MNNQPLRVLHLIETLGRGGAERLLVTMLPSLSEHGIESIVGVMHEPVDLKPALEASGIRVIQLPEFGKWNIPAGVGALRKLCRDEQIDIVHAHLYFPGVYAGVLGATSKIPIFETYHNLAYAGANQDGLKLWFRKKLRSLIAQRSGVRSIGVSQAVADHYSKALALPSVEVVHNTIDLQTIDAALAELQQNPNKEKRLKLVVPGRLVLEKGHADLLEALSEADLPPFDLHFLGGGPLKDDLAETAVRLNVPVRISDSIAHDRFLQQVASADICIVPSRHEGFGITAAEAMALGVPVVASNAGGLPEVVGDAALTFQSGNIEELREAIGQLARDAILRRSLAASGKQRARGMFAVENVSARLAHLYRESI